MISRAYAEKHLSAAAIQVAEPYGEFYCFEEDCLWAVVEYELEAVARWGWSSPGMLGRPSGAVDGTARRAPPSSSSLHLFAHGWQSGKRRFVEIFYEVR